MSRASHDERLKLFKERQEQKFKDDIRKSIRQISADIDAYFYGHKKIYSRFRD